MLLFLLRHLRQRRLRAGLALLFVLCGASLWRSNVVGYAFGKLSESAARDILSRYVGSKSAVKIKSVEPLGTSAVVVAQIETAFRFAQDTQGHWYLAEVRRGDNKWEDVRALAQLLEDERQARARAEMELLAQGLAEFHRERGFYVAANNIVALTDALSPRYVKPVLRLDPWHRPYEYAPQDSGYILRSRGADGRIQTADDIILHP